MAIVGIKARNGFKVEDCLRGHLLFIEDVAEAEVRIGVVGILLEDPLEKLRGLLEVLFLSASEAGDLALDMRGQPVGRQGSVFNADFRKA